MADLFPLTLPTAIGTGGIGIGAQIGASKWPWQQTVISQFANSPRLLALLDSFSDAEDQTANIDLFYDMLWNIDTAVGYGLDVWGRIVDIPRTVPLTTQFFGFIQTGMAFIEPFNNAPFYMGQSLTSSFTLSDNIYRLVILAKALANINAGTIQSLNAVLQILFPNRGNCYVADGQDMTMVYTFEFTITAVELAIVTGTNVLQHPAGVSTTFSFV